MKKKNRKTAPRRKRKKRSWEIDESTKERILKAARKVFGEHPFHSATTRMIAHEAKVDHPLIHYYFGTKDKLFEIVAENIYNEFHEHNTKWLEGLERMSPRDGLSAYLDRLIEYGFSQPESLQLILINMVEAGNTEKLPGYKYLIQHMERTRKTFTDKFPLRSDLADLELFIHCFNNLVITFIGARASQAKVLGLEPDSFQYRSRVKEALMMLFLPWLEKLIYTDKS